MQIKAAGSVSFDDTDSDVAVDAEPETNEDVSTDGAPTAGESLICL